MPRRRTSMPCRAPCLCGARDGGALYLVHRCEQVQHELIGDMAESAIARVSLVRLVVEHEPDPRPGDLGGPERSPAPAVDQAGLGLDVHARFEELVVLAAHAPAAPELAQGPADDD